MTGSRWPFARVSGVLALAAVAAAVAGALYLGFADVYSSTSCSTVPGGEMRCSQDVGRTLAEVNGGGVLWLLAVPIAFTVAIGALVAARAMRWLAWPLAVLFVLACLVSGFTIGMFFLPAAALAVTAVAVDSGKRPGRIPAI